jgi:hypothetical protein
MPKVRPVLRECGRILTVKLGTFSKYGEGLIHQTITFAEKQLFRYDGTHLNDLGNAVLLNDFQGGLETFVITANRGVTVFPDEVQSN